MISTVKLAGMHNIRPAGQMWPAEAFYLARKEHICAYLACLFPIKTQFKNVKTFKFCPLNKTTKFWPAVRFELCTPEKTVCGSVVTKFEQHYLFMKL
jgi:hypothetical protein